MHSVYSEEKDETNGNGSESFWKKLNRTRNEKRKKREREMRNELKMQTHKNNNGSESKLKGNKQMYS